MKLNFCPECASPLMKENTSKYSCVNGHLFWNNPRSATSVILLTGDKALFSKRGIEPQKDKYDFPGGFVEYGEDPYLAVIRELREETGLLINTTDLVLIHGSCQQYIENVSVCDFIFVCQNWKGEPHASDDSAALELLPIKFIDSPDFAWNYKGLVAKLHNFVEY